MTTKELQTISGGYGIVPTCFFPAEIEDASRPARGKKSDLLLVAVDTEFPVCIAGN